jgi:hypothetical protein
MLINHEIGQKERILRQPQIHVLNHSILSHGIHGQRVMWIPIAMKLQAFKNHN